MLRLECGVQCYDWGRKGGESMVARLARDGMKGFQVKDETPYAELWMGTHPTMPSKVEGRPLDKVLEDKKEWLGSYSSGLPFLFKVLSIGKALSIQAHPDKTLAGRLHKEKPELYKDDNHKPEMAIALTPFEGFCGFRPVQEVDDFVHSVPELKELVKGVQVTDKESLKTAFGSLMRQDRDKVERAVRQLKKRLEGLKQDQRPPWSELVLRLDDQFPNDVGIFCTFFLNRVELEPGQAVFLKANDPHAYLSGDIIECMASSDNVVRAGLTPKVRDVETLLSMLTFTSAPSDAQRMKATAYKSTAHTTLYDPPIDEFSVILTHLSPGQTEHIQAIKGPSLCLVTQGKGTIKVDGKTFHGTTGSVWFLGANEASQWTADEQGPDWVIFRAFVE